MEPWTSTTTGPGCSAPDSATYTAGTAGIMPGVELLIIRHGLPVRIDDAEGPADPGLSELGHEQARRVATWLRGEKITAVYTSPMRRAVQTAAPIGEILG